MEDKAFRLVCEPTKHRAEHLLQARGTIEERLKATKAALACIVKRIGDGTNKPAKH